MRVITRDLATYAIAKEVEAGRGSPHGGAYLSFQHCSEAELRAAFGPVIDRLARNDIDLTRMPVEGAEDHDTMSDEAFAQAAERGEFCLRWRAHGLSYGLPVVLNEAIAEGRVVIANLSRTVLPEIHRIYPNVIEVHITASNAVLAARLASRGRETLESIRKRLERADQCDPPGAHAVVLDNSGPLEAAAERFVAVLDSAGSGKA